MLPNSCFASSIVPFLYHTKHVSILDFEPKSGQRLISASYDGSLSLWDFGSMRAKRLDGDTRTNIDFKHIIDQPFRIIEPFSSKGVNFAYYSPTGKHIAVATTSPHILLFSTDLHLELEYLTGDPYMKDLRNTKGHIASINGFLWLSSNQIPEFVRKKMACDKACEVAITWSADGTIRWWNTNQAASLATLVTRNSMNISNKDNMRLNLTGVTICDKFIFVACNKLKVIVYLNQGPWTGIPLHIFDIEDVCLEKNLDIYDYSLRLNSYTTLDGKNQLLILSAISISLWNISEDGKIILINKVLLNCCDEHISLQPLNCVHLVDERLIVASHCDASNLSLFFYDESNLNLITKKKLIELPKNTEKKHLPVINHYVAWHSKLRQFAISHHCEINLCSKKLAANFLISFDENISHKGITIPLKHSINENFFINKSNYSEKEVITPFSTEFEEPRTVKNLQTCENQKKVTASSSITRNIMKRILPSEQNIRNEDPREALLEFAEKAVKNAKFTDPASYSKKH